MINAEKKLYKKGRLKTILQMLADAVTMNIGVLAALLLEQRWGESQSTVLLTIPLMAVITAGIFYCFRVYQIIWRFAGSREIYKIVAAAAVTEGLYYGSHQLFSNFTDKIAGMHLAVYPIAFLISLSLLAWSRLFLRHRKSGENSKHVKKKRTLVIGGGRAGAMIIKDLTNNGSVNEVVGVIDDDREKQGLSVYGARIVGTRDDIPAVCVKLCVEEILFCIPACKGSDRVAILNICAATGCTVKVLPGVCQLMDGKIDQSLIRKVEIEDLLERDPVRIDNSAVMGFVRGKAVLVTGGGGSIGSELCRQLAENDPEELIIFDVYENNAYAIQNELKRKHPELHLTVLIGSVRDEKRLHSIFEKHKPQVVFHAAAHKHVPLMEDSPLEAIKNNVFGTLNTARAAGEFGTERFVLISTDKAVNPTNVMGATKRICEMIVQNCNKEYKTEFVAVRFGNVLGSNGSVVPLFKEQIAAGGPVTVTHPDIIRYFMTIPEAVSLVLQAGALAKGGEIFVLDMGKPVRILDMAEKLIRLSGYEPYVDIKIQFSGLRPGEKLYEELLMDEEGLSGTENTLIHIGRPIAIQEDFFERLENLRQTLSKEDGVDARAEIKALVPTYHPKI